MTSSKAYPSGAPATIVDVAQVANVSIRTVSRVINGSPKVGSATRERIQEAIDRLGFEPNSRARGLASGRSYLIGVVQDDPNAHVIGIIQRCAAEVCGQHGYELVVHPTRFDDPGVVEDILGFVRRSKVDGLLLLPPISELQSVSEALAAIGLPAVALAAVQVGERTTMVLSREREGAGLVARHLIELGHTRIAVITGPMRFQSAQQRLSGFSDVLCEHGLPLVARYVSEGDYSFASGLASAARLLSLDEPPTAIFASNDIMAAAVIKYAGELRLRLPEQLSIVGFDDSDLASMLTPALTTVRRPLAEMTSLAAGTLLAQIAGRDVSAESRPFDLTLEERSSTCAPNARAPKVSR